MKLCIEHLFKKYGELQVLRDLSLTLEQDACYCLMSPSGSGKTTLLRILMGLETADSGRIFTQGGPGWPLSFSGGSSLSFLFPYGKCADGIKRKMEGRKTGSGHDLLTS